MYNLPYFKEQDAVQVLAFMRAHPFAILMASTGTWPAATQVPLLFEEREDKLFLRGHFMRNTDHHKAFRQNAHALCLFTGPHAYVSASWYTQPQQASTWNYMSVHAKGILNFLDERALRNILQQTTSQFENNPASPASYHHLPAAYIDNLIGAIVGFEIEVTAIDHVFKLSQNRDAESYQAIVTHLQHGDASACAVATEMEKRLAQQSVDQKK
jgi:transcriptional regulator